MEPAPASYFKLNTNRAFKASSGMASARGLLEMIIAIG